MMLRKLSERLICRNQGGVLLSSSTSSSWSLFFSARRTLATVVEEQESDDEGALIKALVSSRYSAKAFQDKPIPEKTIRSILSATLRCPTSFNIQPYTIVMVKSKDMREKLAECMLGPNKGRVLKAPVTAVFAADLEPVKLVSRLQAMERQRGLPESYLATLPFSIAFLAGEGKMANAFKDIFTTALSPLQTMPSINSLEAWSYKNTALVASWYMLAATAHGLDTCPMEGFDGRRIQSILRIPAARYSIPMVVSTGYVEESPASPSTVSSRSPRFPPETMVFNDRFGKQYKDIPVL